MFAQNEKKSTSLNWLSDLLLLSLTIGIFYILWLGSYALFTPDEGRYSEIAREMVVTGNYLTPRLNGVVFLDKPILYYWLQALAIHIFGLKEWALRFWPISLGILGTLMTYVGARFLFNRRTGFLSAVILATSPLYFGAAHYANLDLEVAVWISNALICFLIALHLTKLRQRHFFFLLAYSFCGCAALTKGLIGLVFPAMIIGTWILILNRWHVLKKIYLIQGILIFTVITLPWYALVQYANPEFLQFFFVKQQFSRFLTMEHFNNRTPVWFYLPIVLIGLFPWCIFLLQTLYCHISSVWKNKQAHSVILFLLLWLGLIFIFFSIPHSKTIGYILPIFPALALLIGRFLDLYWENFSNSGLQISKTGFLLICFGVAIFFLFCIVSQPTFFDKNLIPSFICYTVIFLFAGIATLLTRISLRSFLIVLTFTATSMLLTFIANTHILNQKSIKPLAVKISSQLQPQDEVVTYYKYYQDLPIYLERRITIVADWNAADIPLNDNWLRELWYGKPYQDTSQWLIDETTFQQRWHSNKRLYVFTDKRYRDKFNHAYFIAEHHDMILLSNRGSSLNIGKSTQQQIYCINHF